LCFYPCHNPDELIPGRNHAIVSSAAKIVFM
jgi:hypothetical protein